MGVPKFFRYISERYPCLSELVRENQVNKRNQIFKLHLTSKRWHLWVINTMLITKIVRRFYYRWPFGKISANSAQSQTSSDSWLLLILLCYRFRNSTTCISTWTASFITALIPTTMIFIFASQKSRSLRTFSSTLRRSSTWLSLSDCFFWPLMELR